MAWDHSEWTKLTFSYGSPYLSLHPPLSHSHSFPPWNNWGFASPCHCTRTFPYFSFATESFRPDLTTCLRAVQIQARFATPPRNLISHHVCLCIRLWVGINPQFWPTPGAPHQLQGQHSSQPVVHADREIPGADPNLHKLVVRLPLTLVEPGSALWWDNYGGNLSGRLRVNDCQWMTRSWAEGRDCGRRKKI